MFAVAIAEFFLAIFFSFTLVVILGFFCSLIKSKLEKRQQTTTQTSDTPSVSDTNSTVIDLYPPSYCQVVKTNQVSVPSIDHDYDSQLPTYDQIYTIASNS